MNSRHVVTAALLLVLAGCGQKGSLYFADPAATPANPTPTATDDKDADSDAPSPQDP